jgi:hypothetical protein
LELRWNAALQKVEQLEDRLRDFDLTSPILRVPDKEIVLALAQDQDLPAVWNASSADMRLKQRIVGILIEEIVAMSTTRNAKSCCWFIGPAVAIRS